MPGIMDNSQVDPDAADTAGKCPLHMNSPGKLGKFVSVHVEAGVDDGAADGFTKAIRERQAQDMPCHGMGSGLLADGLQASMSLSHPLQNHGRHAPAAENFWRNSI